MKKLLSLAVVSLLIVGMQTPVSAGSHEAKTQKYINESIRSWLGSKELHQAIHQQNLNHSGLTADEISVLDTRWRAERAVGGGDLVNSKMSNDLSTFLRGIKAASGGIITEIFVMDDKGLNVGQTNLTGDYMQGDEAKWKKTFLVGSSAVFIDDVEKEDGLNIAQTSLTVARNNGFTLGAVTIGINVDALK